MVEGAVASSFGDRGVKTSTKEQVIAWDVVEHGS